MIQSPRNAITIGIIGAILSITILFAGSLNQPDTKSQFTPQFQIIEARTQNTLIEIYIDTPQELMQKAQQLNTTTIYKTTSGYVIIDHATNIGYIYYSEMLWFGGSRHYMWLSILPAIGSCLIINFWDSGKEAKE